MKAIETTFTFIHTSFCCFKDFRPVEAIHGPVKTTIHPHLWKTQTRLFQYLVATFHTVDDMFHPSSITCLPCSHTYFSSSYTFPSRPIHVKKPLKQEADVQLHYKHTEGTHTTVRCNFTTHGQCHESV